MARKPVDKLNKYETRQAVWKVIRKQRANMTALSVAGETCLDVDSVRDYLIGLASAGYLQERKTKLANPRKGFQLHHTFYDLIKDVGLDAPRVRRDGEEVTQGQGQDNIWRAIPILKSFTAHEMAVSASTAGCIIKQSTAETYLRMLCKAGYLVKSRVKGRYQWLKSEYSGPRPPQIQKTKQVYDPNRRQVVWSSSDAKRTGGGS